MSEKIDTQRGLLAAPVVRVAQVLRVAPEGTDNARQSISPAMRNKLTMLLAGVTLTGCAEILDLDAFSSTCPPDDQECIDRQNQGGGGNGGAGGGECDPRLKVSLDGPPKTTLEAGDGDVPSEPQDVLCFSVENMDACAPHMFIGLTLDAQGTGVYLVNSVELFDTQEADIIGTDNALTPEGESSFVNLGREIAPEQLQYFCASVTLNGLEEGTGGMGGNGGFGGAGGMGGNGGGMTEPEMLTLSMDIPIDGLKAENGVEVDGLETEDGEPKVAGNVHDIESTQ